MENMLGLIIDRVKEGESNLMGVNNEGDWGKNIWDLREDLKCISNLDETSSVLVLRNIPNGYLMAVVSFTSGRATDYKSAWIYVPERIVISGDQLSYIVEETRKQMVVSRRNNEYLKDLFSKKYPVKDVAIGTFAGSCYGEAIAFRYYGNGTRYTLSGLLENFPQDYYAYYKHIFLIDAESEVKCNGGNDLTDRELLKCMDLQSPGEVEGFEPYINGEPFNGRRSFGEGREVYVQWRKDGYRPIDKKVVVGSGNEFEMMKPKPEEHIRVIPYGNIKVFGKDNKPLDAYELFVDKKLVQPDNDVEVRDELVENVQIEVIAKGYKPFKISCSVDLEDGKSLDFNLMPLEEETVSTEVEKQNTSKKHKKQKNQENPEGDDGICEKKKSKGSCLKAVGLLLYLFFLLVGLIAGVVISNHVRDGKYEDKYRKYTDELVKADCTIDSLKNKIEELNKKSSARTSLEKAILYLDGNLVWNKREMEKNEHLKGLWDAMNKMQFKEVLRYQEKLKNSVIFAIICDAIEKNMEKQAEIYDKSMNPTSITVSRYIGKLYQLKGKENKERPKNPGSQGKHEKKLNEID